MAFAVTITVAAVLTNRTVPKPYMVGAPNLIRG